MRLQRLIESSQFERGILVLIIINAMTLGLETSDTVTRAIGPILTALDRVILAVFVLELGMRLWVYRTGFFRDLWRNFDLLIIVIALLPASGNLSILRALRILRVLRVVGMMPSLRRVVGGLVASLPGMGSITLLLALVFYIFSVMATNLYGDAFPQWFGTLGRSAYSLFQIMTLESWSMGIVRPVLVIFPFAWIFFVVFIICTTFTVLNLFIGIIVSAMQAEHEDAANAEREALRRDQARILEEVSALRQQIKQLSEPR